MWELSWFGIDALRVFQPSHAATVGIVDVQGLGAAARIAGEEMEADEEWISMLSQRLVHGITSQLDQVVLNGDAEQRYPGNVNLSFAYVEVQSSGCVVALC